MRKYWNLFRVCECYFITSTLQLAILHLFSLAISMINQHLNIQLYLNIVIVIFQDVINNSESKWNDVFAYITIPHVHRSVKYQGPIFSTNFIISLNTKKFDGLSNSINTIYPGSYQDYVLYLLHLTLFIRHTNYLFLCVLSLLPT